MSSLKCLNARAREAGFIIAFCTCEQCTEQSFSSKAKQAYIALAQSNQALADLLATQPGNAIAVREYRAQATKAMQAAEQYEMVENIKV